MRKAPEMPGHKGRAEMEIKMKKKKRPIVAVVGRPNVGKSTLFNALAGERISIVKDTPGITRDRIYADTSWLDMPFTLIDTGGIEPDSKDIILSQMREQAQIAIDTADVILFLVDVRLRKKALPLEVEAYAGDRPCPEPPDGPRPPDTAAPAPEEKN